MYTRSYVEPRTRVELRDDGALRCALLERRGVDARRLERLEQRLVEGLLELGQREADTCTGRTVSGVK